MELLASFKSLLRTCIFLGLLLSCVHCQIDVGDPCASDTRILVPEDKRCLTIAPEALTWARAQAYCERRNGTLYRLQEGRLESRPGVARCLASYQNAGVKDLWIDAVGTWSPHFLWIDRTFVNPVRYCPYVAPFHDENTPQFANNWLSVEHCVANCNLKKAKYTVITTKRSSGMPLCFCEKTLEDRFKVACPQNPQTVDYTDRSRSFIIEAGPNSMIDTEGMDVHTDTDPMCATVNTKTLEWRNYSSNTCFTKNPYICTIGATSYCQGQERTCNDIECYIGLPQPINKCLLRVNRNQNWYAARAHCDALGGDLWNPHNFTDLAEVSPKLRAGWQYWIGATNYGWTFATNSLAVTKDNIERRKCGHTFREQGKLWDWGDTVCDQNKQFMCEFYKGTFTREQYNDVSATCPWPITVEIPDPLTQTTVVRENDDDPFPLAAVISAIVAGIMLLTALALGFGFCWRRGWLAGGFAKVRERLAFIPYFADVSQVADYESHAANMSSVSEHGSQTGLVKGGYHSGGMSAFAMSSSSYTEQSNGGAFASGQGNSQLDATYATMPKHGTDYMTLQAQMEIKDDAELASLRGSVRRKPEVALVTDNVDMNFTVNKAVNRTFSHAGSERSRSSLERTMEEIHSERGGVSMSLPERVAEAKFYTHTTST